MNNVPWINSVAFLGRMGLHFSWFVDKDTKNHRTTRVEHNSIVTVVQRVVYLPRVPSNLYPRGMQPRHTANRLMLSVSRNEGAVATTLSTLDKERMVN